MASYLSLRKCPFTDLELLDRRESLNLFEEKKKKNPATELYQYTLNLPLSNFEAPMAVYGGVSTLGGK